MKALARPLGFMALAAFAAVLLVAVAGVGPAGAQLPPDNIVDGTMYPYGYTPPPLPKE